MDVAVSIGKYTLESLTTGMYSSPKDLYREYIQNSVDSIDQAILSGLIDIKKSEINISIDRENTKIVIQDNGMGIPSNIAAKKLTDIGNSDKAYSVNRGFRGIGRLAGISYCDKLTFLTSYFGDEKKVAVTFDCVRLRELLIPGMYSEYDLSDVLAEVTNKNITHENSKKHYFKVILEGVHDIDGILNYNEVKDYLCQVAPLPFNEYNFKWGKEIQEKLKIKGIWINEYDTYIMNENGKEKEKLFKYNSDKFLTDKIKKLTDEIRDIEIIEIVGQNGKTQAIMWYSICNYYGTILDESKKGIRLRKGNILIGDKNTLNSIFKEDRFNGWFQGEVHVIDQNIIPNARRDNFEKNSAYIEFMERLYFIGDKLSKVIRNISNMRNNKSSKLLNEAEATIAKTDMLLGDGFNSQNEKLNITKELAKLKDDVSNLNIKDEFNLSRKFDIFKQLEMLSNAVKGATNFKVLNLSNKLANDQKKILEKVFETITDQCSKKEADRLINEIMQKF